MGVRAVGWTEDEDTELKRLLDLDKHSTREIAGFMSKQFNRNFTRSTIVGRMFRMRQRGRIAPCVVKPVVKKVEKVEKVEKVKPTYQKMHATSSLTNAIKANIHPMMYRRKPNPNPAPKRVYRQPDTRSEHNCTLDELTGTTCRFPLGEVDDHPPYIYCGAVTLEKTSFCGAHCEVCFTPNGMALAIAKTKSTRT